MHRIKAPTDEELRELMQIRADLDQVGPLVDRVEVLAIPGRGSRAARAARKTFGNLGTTFAHSAIASGLDHLRAWAMIANGPDLPAVANWSLIRGAIEGAAVCRWLIDPAQEERELIRRGAVLQLDDWRDRERFERSVGVGSTVEFPVGSGKSGAVRLADHIDRMRRAGLIGPAQNPRDVQPPSMRDLVADYANESIWRLASGFAHSSPWTGMAQERHGRGRKTIEGSRQLVTSANIRYLRFGTRSAVQASSIAVRELEDHFRSSWT